LPAVALAEAGGPEGRVLRRVLLAIAATLVVVAVVLAVSGGFRTTVGGFRISARSPLAASIAALVAGAAWVALARRERAIASDLEATWRAMARNASRIIGVVALIAAIVAGTFATRSAAGADASGYLSQAAMWSIVQPAAYVEMVAREHNELDGWTTTPLGWRPVSGACDFECEGMQLPTYPPGLPLLMAVPHLLAGINGATAVVTASAAIATWAAGMIAGGIAGIMAATFLAFAPVFLHQSIQPMSDVPVTAAWMLCFLLVRGDKPLGLSLLAGIACAIAVLIRPNLAPLAIVPLLVSRNKRWFATPVVVAGAFLAVIHEFWYGSPFRSGYGSAEELFSIANIFPNAGKYASWLVATSPVLFMAPLGFARVRNDRHARALIVFALLVIGAYLIYAVFDHWSYLRFLLPALAVFAILAGIELHAWIDRWPAAWRLPLFLTVVLVVSAYGLFVARTFDTFKLADQLRRVEQVGEFISGYGGERPIIISGEQSGAIRYYTMNPIVRWDAATPEMLRAAIAAIERSGHSTYIALDAWEFEPFLKKFATVPEVQLDWPPMLEAGSSHRTRVWRISDRARFLEGTQLPTVRLP
jgi:4-amino-4-deoxy-L-arabinose transferase-like glycosyltransferase